MVIFFLSTCSFFHGQTAPLFSNNRQGAICFTGKRKIMMRDRKVSSCLFGVGSFEVIRSTESTSTYIKSYSVHGSLKSSRFLFSFTSPIFNPTFCLYVLVSSCRRLIFPLIFAFIQLFTPRHACPLLKSKCYYFCHSP